MVGCATQRPPQGGPKDTTPPEFVPKSSAPANQTTNFQATKIILTFDEFIQLSKPRQQIIITPNMAKWPKFLVKGKRLIIELLADLNPNTTYSINFGEAIQDYTEGNPVKNFRYIFSTGESIDSLSLSGSVVDALTRNPVANASVMLYTNLNDSTPYQEDPLYVIQTSSQGTFQLDYLHEGTYKVIGLVDNNKDYKYDGASEQIAFLKDPIQLNSSDSSLKPLKLQLFEANWKKQFIAKKKYAHPNKAQLILNIPDTATEFKWINVEPTIVQRFPNGDTINFWFSEIQPNQVLAVNLFKKGNVIDSAEIKTFVPRKETSRKLLVFGLSGEQDFKTSPKIKFNYPIHRIDTSNWELFQDTMRIPILLDSNLENQEHLSIWLRNKLKPKTNYTLTIKPDGVASNFAQNNDTTILAFSTSGEEDYGNLLLSMALDSSKASSNKHILEVLNKAGNVVFRKSIAIPSETAINRLLPGQYQLRLILDENNNGRWDTGDYLNKQQPEKIIYYEGTIEVRANWDISLDWNLGKVGELSDWDNFSD